MGDSDSSHDPLDAATKFDAAVRATAVIGTLVTKVTAVETLALGIDTKVDILLAHDNRAEGEKHALTALISLAVSLATIGSAIAGWFALAPQHP